MKLQELYRNSYFAFNRNLEQNISFPPQPLQCLTKTCNIYSKLNDNFNESIRMKEKLAAHEYKNSVQTQEIDSPKSLTLVKTVKDKIYPPVYFFGDPLGLLTWRSRCRTFETLEASIIFDVEEDEDVLDDHPQDASEHDSERPQDKESNIVARINNSEEKDNISSKIPDMNILKDKKKGYTKEEIVNIYCNLQDI